MKSSKKYFIQILNFLCLFSLILFIKGKNINQENISLRENETIKKYIIKNEDHSCKLSIDNLEDLNKILIDLMIFSGDVILNFKEQNENIHKYETANKIFCSISTDGINLSDLDFVISALKNSYYSVRFTVVKKDQKESDITNIIPGNTNFLLTMYPFDEDGGLNMVSKKLMFKKESNNNHPFVVNFNSLNCDFKFYKIFDNEKKEELKSIDDYFVQDVINPDDERYQTKEYSYITEIISVEQGTYNKKMCMFYASGADLENNILVGENVPQEVIFNSNGLTQINYLYQIPDIKNDLAIKFILDNRSQYEVKFFIEQQNIKEVTITSDQQEIIESSSYSKYCQQDQECKLTIEIKLNYNQEQNEDFELEVAIKSISEFDIYPSYLIKNEINSEYLNFKSPNYYYTDIGQAISGEIIINYYRGNGMVFGKIVKKNKEPDANPEWRGIYEFPSRINDSLKYTSYLKKLSFTEEDTKDCEDECYLLLSVVNNITSIPDGKNYDNSRYFGFDILIITESVSIQSLNPLITLPLNKYVIGSISKKESSPDFIRYYIINIPYDAEKVIFDLQSEDVAMYINIYFKDNPKYDDYRYPSSSEHIWEFFSRGKPEIFELSKQQILDSANGLVDSLSSVSLTICIEAQKNENDLSTIYALKYHLELNQELNIYEIYSDQQTICKTEKKR